MLAATFTPAALSPATASVIVKVSGKKTLYLIWQGTMAGERPMDMFTDLAAGPVSFTEESLELHVHSAMWAKVNSDFLNNKAKIVQAIKEDKCEKVVFTGHSLGGGCALLAHLNALLIQRHAEDLC